MLKQHYRPSGHFRHREERSDVAICLLALDLTEPQTAAPPQYILHVW